MPEPDRAAQLAQINQHLQQELAERKRAEAEAAQLARELRALHEATLALLGTLDLEALLGRILDSATSAIPAAERGMLYLVAPETGNLEMRAAIGYGDPRIQRLTIPGARGVIARAVRDRAPQLVNDVQTEPLVREIGALPEMRAMQSAIVAPLVFEGKALGALSLDSSRRKAFTGNDLRLLVSFAATATAALRNARLHAEVQKMALTDSVTPLYNRHGFLELGRREIERARRFARPLSAIMIDVDGFKKINDIHGHAAGDIVLREIARRLNNNIRDVDIVSRYGGDEFAILLPETDLFTASSVAERLRLAIQAAPFPAGAGSTALSISQGVARASPQTPDLANLIERADAAMYRAKASGGNRVVIG
jgi:diguanylate cyclase (GGDEF)-like protein